jgi:hypothetical protein
MSDREAHEQRARDYLARELSERAPEHLVFVAGFDASPLEREGGVSIFSFSAAVGGDDAESFYVVAGETEPNYYPAWNLSPEEIFEVHLGTRFMLVVGVGQFPVEELPESLEADVRAELERVAPSEPVTQVERVAAFHAQDQRHAVCRVRIAHEDVYVFAGDLPFGVSRRTDLPPHVVYRLHLGRALRMEPTDDAD